VIVLQYLLEVEKKNYTLKDIKNKLRLGSINYNIRNFYGELVYARLCNTLLKEYFIFNILDDIDNINTYFINNLDSINIYSPNMGNIFDIRSKLYLFGDIYITDDFILSSFSNDNVFYIRKRDTSNVDDINYMTILNILRDYYADILGIYFELDKYKIDYINTLDNRFIKVYILPLEYSKKLELNKKR